MTTEDRGGDTRRTLVWGLAVLALLLVGIGLGEWHTSEQISKESSELWAGLSEAILALMLFFAGFIVALSALVLALTARRARAAALVVLAIAVAVPLATAGDSGESATAPRIEGWKPLGPGGKGVNSIVVDPRTPGTVYAGIDSDEAVKSTDGGESWDGLGIELNEAGLLVVDPAPPRVVYAARTDFPNDFVMKSTDGGESWTGANRGLQGGEGGLDPGVTAIALHPARSRTLYAATQAGGIYRSTNGGRSWATVASTNHKVSDIDAFFGEHNLAVDSTGRRVYVGTPGAGILVCETCWGVQS